MKKNNIKTPEEKEFIIKRYLNGESATKIADKLQIDKGRIYKWLKKYEKEGLEGLKSKTGKASKYHEHMGLYFRKPKNKIEELELEIMKKDIEIARLKKGYNVKGAGQKKEFVTIFNKNTK